MYNHLYESPIYRGLNHKTPLHCLDYYTIDFFYENKLNRISVGNLDSIIDDIRFEDVLNNRKKHGYKFYSFRDNYFLESNFIIIKFAEIQIIKSPEECCNYIAQKINEITSENKYLSNKKIKQLKPVKMWSYNDAILMIKKQYRENIINSLINYNYFSFNQERLLSIRHHTYIPRDYVDDEDENFQ